MKIIYLIIHPGGVKSSVDRVYRGVAKWISNKIPRTLAGCEGI